MDTDPRLDFTDPMGNGFDGVLHLAMVELIALASIGSLVGMLALDTRIGQGSQDGESHVRISTTHTQRLFRFHGPM